MTLSVDVLEQAKTALQQHGWTKNDLVHCDTGELCALGALAVALGVSVTTRERIDGTTVYDLRYPYSTLEPPKEAVKALGQYPVYGTEEERREWVDKSNALWKRFNDAEQAYDETFQAYDRVLVEAVQELSGGETSNVPAWNDRVDSTLQDVLDVFDTAIKNIKQKESSSV